MGESVQRYRERNEQGSVGWMILDLVRAVQQQQAEIAAAVGELAKAIRRITPKVDKEGKPTGAQEHALRKMGRWRPDMTAGEAWNIIREHHERQESLQASRRGIFDDLASER